MNDEKLTAEQIQTIRNDLVSSAEKLLGVLYKYGAEWTIYAAMPETLDCSEMIEGIFNLQHLKMPDGSQNQYQATIGIPKEHALPGDLAFFGRGGHPNQIYHVGMVYDDKNIIEARAYDPEASFETGKVILRPIKNWIAWKNFVGFTRHPKLLA